MGGKTSRGPGVFSISCKVLAINPKIALDGQHWTAIYGNRLLKFLPFREYRIASRLVFTPMAR